MLYIDLIWYIYSILYNNILYITIYNILHNIYYICNYSNHSESFCTFYNAFIIMVKLQILENAESPSFAFTSPLTLMAKETNWV